MELMGAKDAITMIMDMDFDLPDTRRYYTIGFQGMFSEDYRIPEARREAEPRLFW